MTRYVEAFSWTRPIADFLSEQVVEKPLLNVCSGREPFGDVTADRYEPADVRCSWTSLPFADDSFGAVFADPPWDSGYKADSSAFIRDALRVAPVVYLMAPWLYGAARARLSRVWVRQMPGVHTPVLLTRYERVGREHAQSEMFAPDPSAARRAR